MELKSITGIGPKAIINLNKLGIYDVDNLINYYPFRYNILRPVNIYNYIDSDETITINARIISDLKLFFFRNKMSRLSFCIESNGKIMKTVLFNRHYLKDHLKLNQHIAVTGKYDKLTNQFVIQDISFTEINGEIITPVYHLVKGLKQKSIHSYILKAIANRNLVVNDNIPAYLVDKYQFINKSNALKIIHNPNNIQELKKAKLRLIYEELFIFASKINFLKINNKKDNGLRRDIPKNDLLNYIDTLPYLLTSDQMDAVWEIYEDLVSPKRMNRLLMGDVGSGKTIVSIIAMYLNYLSGYQSALMAPTEILAIQHYENILKVLPEYIKVTLLTGKMTKKEKEVIYDDINSGKVNIVVGTHALLNEKLNFNNLGLVVTDEQHRFGVNARKDLFNKGLKPDVLYTTATPIPRTYAMTIFGDMDTSIIKVKPGNRLPVITSVTSEDNIKDVLLLVKKEIDLKHQVYVVAPSIDSEEIDDLNSVKILEEKYHKAFPNIKIGVLHGKLKNAEKDKIIKDFMANKISILISTTVIEVGIDSPNATVMIVYNGERFGLSTLHQLRGRVGRSDLQSYCFIISKKKTERLDALEKSNDGFYIAEVDFKIRGEGDLFGTNQSGDMQFKLAQLSSDYKIFLQALKDSEEAIKNNDETVNKIINSLKIIS